MTLAQTIQPAIDLGEARVVASKQYVTSCNNRGSMDPDTKAICYPNGVLLNAGERYWNKDLVKTFRLIAADGPSGVLRGRDRTGDRRRAQKSYDAGMGGVMTTDDLKCSTST